MAKQQKEDEKRAAAGEKVKTDQELAYEAELKKLDLSKSMITDTAFVPFDYDMKPHT